MFDPSDPNNGVGSNGSPNSQHVPLSPSAQYLASLLASTDPAMDPDLIDFIDFLALRRSQSRSVGSGNSPRQTGNQPPRPPSTNSQPQSAIPNRHPLSPIAVNNLRPPPPPNQRSTEDVTTQKVQSSPARTPRFSTSQWDSHRAKIKELFMDNDKPLDDTMKFMEENFSFAPSYVGNGSASIFVANKLLTEENNIIPNSSNGDSSRTYQAQLRIGWLTKQRLESARGWKQSS
jgi:hypothetical protein